MNKQNLLSSLKVAGIAAGLSLATVVIAAPNDRFPIDIAALEAKAAERFSQIDANDDGQIDGNEFESADIKRPKHMKKHRKGGQKMRKGKRSGEKRQEMRAAVQAELFVLLDADNNGELSAEEHAAQTREISMLARKKAMFKKLDANNDGVLVPEEMPRRGDRLRAADANGDGQVTRQEIRAMRAG